MLYQNKIVFFFISVFLIMRSVPVVSSSQSPHAEMQQLKRDAVLWLAETQWIVNTRTTPSSKYEKDLNKLIIASRDVARQIVKSKKSYKGQRLELEIKRSEQAIMALFIKQVEKEAQPKKASKPGKKA